MYDEFGTWFVDVPGCSKIVVDFNKYKDACYWLSERHNIWYNKEILNAPRPWTANQILDKWKFINVHRKLDVGTKYILDYFATDPDPVSRFANILRYRLFNNRHSHAATGGFTTYKDFNYAVWYKSLRDRWASGERVLCQAHNTCTYSGFPGSDKVERVCLVAKSAIEKAPELLPEIENGLKLGLDVKDVFELVKGLRGFGPFLSYEVILDLSYVYPEISCMEWANPGPGCQRGLDYIFPDHARKYDVELLKVLRQNLELGFDMLGYDAEATISFLKTGADTEGELDLRVFESQMCEFQKFIKLNTGTGRSFGGTYKSV
jgi:hypothetical protein